MSDFRDKVEKSKSLQLPGSDRSLPEPYPFPGYYTFGEEEVDQGWHLRDFWSVLIKRKWWFLGVFVPVVLVVGLYCLLKTPIYRSSAIFQIVQDNPSAIVSEKDPLTALSGGDTVSRFYETQYMLLKSKALADKIVEALNLKEHPEYKKLEKKNPDKTPYEIKNAYLEEFLKKLEVEPLNKSYLVEIFFQSPDKDLAVKVPNAAYKEYLEFAIQTRQQSYGLIREWLENELHQLAAKVEASEKKLYAHGKEKNFLALEGENNVIVKKFVELNNVLTTAQTARAAKEAQYQQVQKRGADAPLIINNPLVQKLREETIIQKAQVASLIKTFGKNYPQLQAQQAKLGELNSRVNGEVERTLSSIKSDYEAALRTENFLREEANRQRKEVEGLQENLVQHNILKRDLQTNEQLYQALLARMKEASVASTMVASNAAVIQPAKPPLEPYSPKKALNMALAALVGLMGGVGMAFLAEHLDSSIKTSEEMERVYHLPTLGVVPLLSTNGNWATIRGDRQLNVAAYTQLMSMLAEAVLHLRNSLTLPMFGRSPRSKAIKNEDRQLALATSTQPMSMLAEAFFHLRASLMPSMSGRPPVTIVVTSPNPGEGKTTLSINLASAMLFGDKKFVLIIDADFRHPTIHKIFDTPLEPGLSNYLADSVDAAQIIKKTSVKNLFIIPAGPTPPHPIQLLSSGAFQSLLERLKQDFAHIVIDTPPIIGFADVRVIAHMVDGVLMVIKHHQTSRDSGKLAIQLLNQSYGNILGVVLNMAQSDKMGYGGYYDYYKYYHKYYDGYSKDSEKKA